MSTRQIWGAAIGLGVALLVIGGIVTKPSALEPPTDSIAIDTDTESYLSEREAKAHARYGIVPGAAKQVRWHGDAGVQTPYAVVYLHGFSATRQEIAPVAERVARALEANLFETRLAGHGRVREPMAKVPAEAWLDDGVEALTIGAELGERVVIIGTSTGATLALALTEHPLFQQVESIVFVSPNWGPADESSDLLVGPYGPQLMRLVAGEVHSWTAANDLQERYWSTEYPTDALVEMMRLVELADGLTDTAAVPSALLVYSPKDDVVSVPRLLEGFERLPAGRKDIYKVDEPRSLSNHVLAGDILGPDETEPTVERIVEFLKAS